MELITKIEKAFTDNGYSNIKQSKNPDGNICMSGSKTNKSKTINLSNMANIYGNLKMFHFNTDEEVMNEIDVMLVNSFNLKSTK